MINVSLTFPPSLNMLYNNVRGKGRRKTPRYAGWQRVAQTEIMVQRGSFLVTRIAGPVEITITLSRKHRRGDIDNLGKAIIDVLVKMALMDDDKNVERLVLQWGECEGADVEIKAFEGKS